jgi:hypothetical protein
MARIVVSGVNADRATARATKGLLLARQLSMRSFMANKRNKVITVAVAGTLTLATAISAAAATLPSGTAAAPASASNAFLTTVDAHAVQAAAANAAAQHDIQSQQLRAAIVHAEQRAAIAKAAAKAAAAKAAAERKAAAAKAAAAAAAARQAAAQQAAQQQQQAAQQQTTTTVASGSPQQIAQQMLGQYGWSSGQFSCLYSLWERESGWNPSAMNPSSGAYGIPQAMPGSQMASAGSDWQTNPATQIKWGLSYIQGRYGSPCGAWAHSQATGWY